MNRILRLIFCVSAGFVYWTCKSYEKAPTIKIDALTGIFTTSQAESVAGLYTRDCSSCHGKEGRGTEGGSPLTGSAFLSKWKDQTLSGMFELTKQTMPKTNPKSYNDSTYAALISFILQMNNFPPGAKQLPHTKSELDNYIIDSLPASNVPYKYAAKKAEGQITSVESEWTQHRSNYASTNYSSLDQINAGNVNQLKIIWSWKTDNFGPAPEFNYQATPLMVKGILYTTAGSRRAVAAIDGRTGETIWTFAMNEGERTAYAPRQNSGRGVAYWKNKNGNDRVVFITPAYQLVELDAMKGNKILSFGIDGVVDLRKELGADPVTSVIGSTSPPIIVNDVVITGSCFPTGLAPRSMKEMRGDISAYDVRSGKKLWVFHTVPQAGEFGNDTWKNESWKYTGNVGAWAPLSADSALGYVYLPLEAATGDLYGGHRPGDNLFSQSLLCLDAKTGRRVWHYQMIHHDIWDYDLPTAPVLADITVDGKKIKAIAQVSKQAFVYVLDRVTGKPVWPIEERPVPASNVPGEETSPTQPFPAKPAPFDRQGVTEDILIDFTPELKKEALKIMHQYNYGPLYTPLVVQHRPDVLGTLMLPSATGGANWQGAVLDPETNILYVSSTTNIEAMALFSEPSISDMKYVAWWTGGFRERQGGPSGLPLVKPPWGRITAINLNTGDHQWMIANGDAPDWVKNNPALKNIKLPRTGSPDRVGLLITKTLLFAGEGSGLYGATGGGGNKFRSHNKLTGEIISELTLPASQTGVPMTYSINGKQYIVLAIGGKDHPGELVALGL
ncbi:MAG: PQQ-binding-like beta-propeller repeat protein [Saprospiraceae bacterium]